MIIAQHLSHLHQSSGIPYSLDTLFMRDPLLVVSPSGSHVLLWELGCKSVVFYLCLCLAHYQRYICCHVIFIRPIRCQRQSTVWDSLETGCAFAVKSLSYRVSAVSSK